MLDARSREEIAELLGELPEEEQRRLLEAMRTIQSVLDKRLKFSEPFFVRTHEPGDMGWVVQRARGIVLPGVRLGRALRGVGGADRG